MISRLMKQFMGILLAGCTVLGPALAKASITGARASNDATNLYYEFTYSGTPNFFQAFLDTDKSASTGLNFAGIGADFLLENGNLYRYSGANGAWGWTRVKTVTMTNSNSVVRWTVAKADVGSPAGVNIVFRHDNPMTTSQVISQTVTSVATNSISLSVAGAPNLPYNGTSTLVTVGFVGNAPAKVTLARDGLPAFATWPGGTFFTLAADGKSISGNWCISASCWGYQSGAHYLTAVATYADGSSKSSTVSLNVVTSSPSPTPFPSPTPSPTPIAPPSPTPIATPTPTPTPVSSGPTYYVSPSGNDLNAGGSSAPWRTIQKAANMVSPGDTVVLMNGTYEEPSVTIGRSGTASARITFKAQNKWMAILSSYSGCDPAVSVRASYITLKDFRITTSSRNVSCSTYNSSNADIRAWMTQDPSPASPTTGWVGFIATGMKLDAIHRDIAVKSNQDYSILEGCECNSLIELFNSKDSIIRNNVVTGQDPGGNSLMTKGGARNSQIYGNIVHNKRIGGMGIYLGGYSCDACHFDMSTNIEAYNCVAYNNVVINESGGWMSALTFMGAKDSGFFNNVVIGGSISMYVGGHNTGPQAPTQNPTLKNNIFVCNSAATATFTYTGTMAMDYNNFYNCSGVPSQVHPVVGNPMFINQASDWRLQAGSPAINSGTVPSFPAYGGGFIDISRDFNGVVRSAPWDLGIYNVAP